MVMTTADKKQATKPAAQPAAKHKEKRENEKRMYVGPTIPGVATQNVVYAMIPEGLKQAIKENPEMGNLCIPVKEYGAAEKMIRTGSGYIASAYKKALEYKEKRKGGN